MVVGHCAANDFLLRYFAFLAMRRCVGLPVVSRLGKHEPKTATCDETAESGFSSESDDDVTVNSTTITCVQLAKHSNELKSAPGQQRRRGAAKAKRKLYRAHNCVKSKTKKRTAVNAF